MGINIVQSQKISYLCSMEQQVMAIGNITPDSFYHQSRLTDAPTIVRWANEALANGASILDIGGCSTRPGSTPATEQQEWDRVSYALATLRDAIPNAQLSLDTFRPSIAQQALEQFGPLIINDISGGNKQMYQIVQYWSVPYVWTLRGQLDLPATQPQMLDMDIWLDPGFGFIGSVDGDHQCLKQMHLLQQYNKPILVGLSRKSMIYKPLGITPEESLSATQVAQFYALQQGATILRTHDVKATMQTIQLYNTLKYNI